jgi:hypothetical protein
VNHSESTPTAFCDTCAAKVPFVSGYPAYRCAVHGITLIQEGFTKADRCWWYPTDRTTCASHTRAQ